MRSQFQEILALVRAGKPAERSFEAERTEYVRNFYPRERLILLGCGHVSPPVCQYAADLGFAVTVRERAISVAAQLIRCRRANISRRSKIAVLTAEEEGMVCGGQIKVLIEDVVE